VPCDRGHAANDEPHRLIREDADDDVRRGERTGADREPDARVDAGSDEQGRPPHDGNRDGDLPPAPEEKSDEEYGRDHAPSVRSRIFVVNGCPYMLARSGGRANSDVVPATQYRRPGVTSRKVLGRFGEGPALKSALSATVSAVHTTPEMRSSCPR
jgi:hypothetical protein